MFTLARPKCQQYLAKYPNITKKPYTAPEMLASAKLENLRIFLSNLLHKSYTTHGAMYSCPFVSLARWEIIPGGHRYLPHAGSITQLIIKITISSLVIGLKMYYFPLIRLSSCYRTVCYWIVCYWTACYRTV